MSKESDQVHVTHTAAVKIGEDRGVLVQRMSDGGFSIEWQRPKEGCGFLMEVTRAVISEQAAIATAMCLSDILRRIDAEESESKMDER